MSNEQVVRSILDMLTPREREALHRFYVLGQTNAQIVREMGLDEKALQELKTRVKKQYSLWKRRLK